MDRIFLIDAHSRQVSLDEDGSNYGELDSSSSRRVSQRDMHGSIDGIEYDDTLQNPVDRLSKFGMNMMQSVIIEKPEEETED